MVCWEARRSRGECGSMILSGTPCFRGTRVPFKNLIDYLEGGARQKTSCCNFPRSRVKWPFRHSRMQRIRCSRGSNEDFTGRVLAARFVK